MFKACVCGLFLAVALCGSTAVSQARDFEVWGHKFSSGSESDAAPSAPKFNSVVGDPDRGDREAPIDDPHAR